MKRLRIAQIGTEHDHAWTVAKTLIEHKKLFDFAGYVKEDESERFNRTKQHYEGAKELTLDELFNDKTIEAVAIETCEKNLTKYSLLTARHGIHVNMDKPGSVSCEEFNLMVETLKKQNLVFHTGYMYRQNPAVRRTFELIKSGALGEIYAVEAHMDCDHPKEKREWLSSLYGGMTNFLGCHLIDLIYTIQGEPEEIIPLNCSTHKDGVNSTDFGMVLFKYKNGYSFAKACGAEPGGYIRRQVVVCGTKGTVTIMPLEESYSGEYTLTAAMREVYEADTDRDGWKAEGKITKFPPFERYLPFLTEFAQIIRGEKENEYSYEYEMKLHELVMKCCKEAK